MTFVLFRSLDCISSLSSQALRSNYLLDFFCIMIIFAAKRRYGRLLGIIRGCVDDAVSDLQDPMFGCDRNREDKSERRKTVSLLVDYSRRQII